MFKRILAVIFCFVLMFGTASMALAKTAKAKAKPKEVKAEAVEEVVEEEETVIQKMSEPKGNLKDKLALSFSTTGDVTARMWMTKSLGLDMIAGISVGGDSAFGLLLGSNVVFPILEEKNFNLYVTPGLIFELDTGVAAGTVTDVSSRTDLSFLFNAAIEAEVFAIKNLLSIGGSFGLRLGINVISNTNMLPDPDLTTSSTTFQMDIGSTTGALFVRVYI